MKAKLLDENKVRKQSKIYAKQNRQKNKIKEKNKS